MYLTAKDFKYEFNRLSAPVLTISSGQRLTVETFDSYQRRVLKSSSAPEPPPGLPLTGPIMVEGCQVGDLLCVEILDIQCQPVGVTGVGPGSGLCPNLSPTKETLLHRIEPDRIVMPAGFAAPPRPMVGCMGVAPSDAAIASITPGRHGGNLDCPDLRKGAKLYLQVAVPGALLALGDVHGRQGYGEFCGAAVEVGADVSIQVSVIPGQGELANWPLLVTETEIAVLGSDPSLREAAGQAVEAMVNLVARDRRCPRLDAYVALTQVADVRICQLVNPWHTVGCYLSREYLKLESLLA